MNERWIKIGENFYNLSKVFRIKIKFGQAYVYRSVNEYDSITVGEDEVSLIEKTMERYIEIDVLKTEVGHG